MLGDLETVIKMRDVLDSQEDVGVASSLIFLENGNYLACENYQKGIQFEFANKALFRNPSKKTYHKTEIGTMFIYADQVVNFFLAKRAVFRDIAWDNRIKIEWEHIDFFLQLLKSPWKAAVTLETKAVHQMYTPDSDYARFRRNAPSAYFYQKNGIQAVINRF